MRVDGPMSKGTESPPCFSWVRADAVQKAPHLGYKTCLSQALRPSSDGLASPPVPQEYVNKIVLASVSRAKVVPSSVARVGVEMQTGTAVGGRREEEIPDGASCFVFPSRESVSGNTRVPAGP